MRNNTIARRIVSTIPAGRNVIEIGPGDGSLTSLIAEKGFRILAYEIDTRFYSILKERFALNDRVEILNLDALRIIGKDTFLSDNYLVSNLPFNISSAIVGRIIDLTSYPFEEDYTFPGATLMFQKEFAQRLMAKPGSSSYGRLSVTFQTKLSATAIADVNRMDFDPVPDVDATVVLIETIKEPTRSIIDISLYEKVLTASFSKRRKQLKNSLLGLGIPKDVVYRTLEEKGFHTKRPEDLSVHDFIELSNSLSR